MKTKKRQIIIVLTGIIFCAYIFLLVTISKNQNPYCVIISSDKTQYEVVKSQIKEVEYNIPVYIKNKANRELSSIKNFYLSYHLYDEKKKLIQFDNVRTEIPAVFSTDKKLVDLKVEVPLKKGHYFLEPDIVNEGVTWFSEQGNKNEMIEFVIK
ncbi:hypothetical protein [Velocimicrobium porci]|uniref:Uncharacterized protein n=1 Tax=Velocimicrobium porci TaxID=2606634 RepID=A0A6L5Y0N3_9FIRM|nr:hypothetical protein [Velocimicrobium porci]MSS64494.1 hypothetical protein [Velocimicrobium porci]